MTRHRTVAVFVPHLGCKHACSYCDQRAVSGAEVPQPGAVRAQLLEAARVMGAGVRTAQIAFFGGSFTAVAPGLRRRLLEEASELVGPEGYAGIRVSTRPDAIDEEILRELRDYGVQDVELGAQSMDDAVLARNGRGHTAADVRRASALIRAAGLGLGLQMMTGLPGEGPGGALETARELAALRPDGVRVYPALVLRGTRTEQWFRDGSYRPPTLEETVERCADVLELFAQRGVAVIRLGLQEAVGLRESVVAGPHHPALRELCEGRVLLRSALAQLAEYGGQTVVLRVHPGCVSKMTGQRRCNLLALEEKGIRARVVPDPAVPPMKVLVARDKQAVNMV